MRSFGLLSLVPKQDIRSSIPPDSLRLLPWAGEHAKGQLFQDTCFQVASRQAVDSGLSDFDMLPYFGMYDASCPCSLCSDRAKLHASGSNLKIRFIEKKSLTTLKYSDALHSDCERLGDADALHSDCERLKTPSTVTDNTAVLKEEYKIRKAMVNDIKLRLKIQDTDIMWILPPISENIWQEVTKKRLKAIILAPLWIGKNVPRDLLVAKYYYPNGTRLFERSSSSTPGCPWPMWAQHVDGSRQISSNDQFDLTEAPKIQPTSSSQRRRRRKEDGDIVLKTPCCRPSFSLC